MKNTSVYKPAALSLEPFRHVDINIIISKYLYIIREPNLIQDSVEELIEENVVSSAKYNYLQNKHVTTKNNYQRVIGKRLDLEIGVNEITKVC